jgi:putative flippase GtrA
MTATPLASPPRIDVSRRGRHSRFLRFAAIGLASTLAYLLLYVALRQVMSAQVANAVALLGTAVANTAANRRITFDVAGRAALLRHHLQGLAVFAAALALTSGSLAMLHTLSASPPRAAEIAVLVVANLGATVLRFVLLRGWVFGP